jgi:hypothetical protein
MAGQNTWPPIDALLDPVIHVIEWFVEISEIRTHTVVATMAGGGVMENRIPFTEIEAWSRTSGNHPTAWEMGLLRLMDSAYVSAKIQKSNSSNVSSQQHQGLGDYCHGTKIENCRVFYGPQLETVCSTCPN